MPDYGVGEGRIDPTPKVRYCVPGTGSDGDSTAQTTGPEHILPLEWRMNRDDARKDDRSGDPSAAPSSPQLRKVDLGKAAEILSRELPRIRLANEEFEIARKLPPDVMNFRVSL